MVRTDTKKKRKQNFGFHMIDNENKKQTFKCKPRQKFTALEPFLYTYYASKLDDKLLRSHSTSWNCDYVEEGCLDYLQLQHPVGNNMGIDLILKEGGGETCPPSPQMGDKYPNWFDLPAPPHLPGKELLIYKLACTDATMSEMLLCKHLCGELHPWLPGWGVERKWRGTGKNVKISSET